MVHLVAVRDEAVVESRLVGLYDMIGHVAAVVACSGDRDCFAAAFESVVIPIVASARPTWKSRKVVALADLWSLEVSPSSG